ncbi:DUF309 domain-containing protein [candidate division KSB1 bacterium]|nr:DUF309 domain-containing protein [candidate division KSB1 bacterium]NIR72878.1 DUF309 domain-containing protein [candidate division KSB1 bacterium]NIS25155.1 DUF309 domain-containing protein [candidate division KSB1 bacterium]NIT72066.1 DUF309 domain-containing protein [candidate division KSB1 bacterium]NIU25857.1 DUF309 domain-containing protein [candidate division KSB1 bacterium]
MTSQKENLFQQGVKYFNNGYFFEAHDTFEELWLDEREESKVFYQGLVQLSTGFYHLVMKNLKGAESQLTKGLQKLSKYEPKYENIDVSELIRQVKTCLERIRETGNGGFHRELIQLIPKLTAGVN